jgi:glycyl-tRNA synthetase beta chain
MTDKDFIVEIGCGELPPKALRALSAAFTAGIRKGLEDAALSFGVIEEFAAPRRLAVRVSSLQTTQRDVAQERFGPAVAAAFDKEGSPTPAASGFARSCGVDISALEQTEKDGVIKLVFRSVSRGRATTELLPGIVSQALARLPIPRKMRWGSSREEFVRPVHWVLMLLGTDVVPCTLFGIEADNTTRGHRFHSSGSLPVADPAAYESVLLDARVIADYEKRKARVKELISEEGRKLSANVVIDEDLLEEVTSMVEWPVALTGRFDTEFLKVPAEALVSSMKNHQKCFYLLDSDGLMLPNFIAVSNLESRDPAQVIAGNERVIRPRLADAAFFFDTDRKQTLASRQEQLKTIVFQQELGTVHEKSQRVANLAGFIAERLDANRADCERAALLAKCDLITSMVSEFAELQGIMGYHYATHDGESPAVAAALNEQYMPRFAGDSLPQSITGSILAVADKLDTIVGLFAIGQPPTGSKDPFALRRAAIGLLRILVEKELDLNILDCINSACSAYAHVTADQAALGEQVFEFLLERFRAWYQGEGISAEVFQSVFVMKPVSPLDFDRRVNAVHAFSSLPESAALAAANKRVSNILQKQGSGAEKTQVNEALFSEAAEKQLASVIAESAAQVTPLFAAHQYREGLAALAGTRSAVDGFFDEVLVMAEDDAVRMNRLALIAQLRDLFLQVADISCLHTS